MLLKTEAVVHLVLLPCLKIDDKVDLLAILNRAHTEETSYVNDTDTAKLNVVTNDLGRSTNERGGRYTLNLNGIIGNKTVTALKKLDSGLTLTYTRVTEEQNTLTVNLHKYTVSGDTGTKLYVKKCDKCSHKLGGCLRRTKEGHAIFLSKLDYVILNRQRGGVNNTRGLSLKEVLKSGESLLLGHLGDIHILHLADNLKSGLLIVVIEAYNLETGTVYTATGNLNRIGLIWHRKHLESKFIYNL